MMTRVKDLNLAFVAIARTTYDIPLAAEMMDKVRKSLTDARFRLHGPDGLVTNGEEADGAIAALAERPIDLLILLQATFADSTMTFQVAEKIDAPLLLWPCPKSGREGGWVEFLLRNQPGGSCPSEGKPAL